MQASDSKYWEQWDRQKLSSELELKRQHILKMNQVGLFLFQKPLNFSNFRCYLYSSFFQNITNQLIELERHFNGLELNKFGGNEESQVSERALQRKFGSSRYFHFFFLALRCKTFVIFVLLLFFNCIALLLFLYLYLFH